MTTTVRRRAAARAHRACARFRTRLVTSGDDAGDVPGWVLVTLMTAGLVTALWAVAEPQLTALFSDAIDSVTGP